MLLTEKELEEVSQLDPTIIEYMRQHPDPPRDLSNLASIRATMASRDRAMNDRAGSIQPGILEESYMDVALREGLTSTLKICKPVQATAAGSPLVVLIFGGGFVGGSIEQFTAMANALVVMYDAIVLSIGYRLAPEHLFPAAQLDAWDSVQWIAEHTKELGANPSKGFIVGGISAGATIASVVVTHAVNEPLAHPITGQWLCWPSLFDAEHVPETHRPYFLSLKHNENGPGLNSAAVAKINVIHAADTTSPWRYPINSSAPIASQPRALIMAGGSDPLRDDALIWAAMLEEAGVETKSVLWKGCPHGHWMSFHGLEVSKNAVADILQGFGWLLAREVKREEAMEMAF